MVTTRHERRMHRRLEIRLPLEYCLLGDAEGNVCRTVTKNISTGGLYFETDDEDIRPGMVLSLGLTIPPGEGHFPYQGRVTGTGEVVRVTPLGEAGPGKPRRIGVATRFCESLKLSFDVRDLA